MTLAASLVAAGCFPRIANTPPPWTLAHVSPTTENLDAALFQSTGAELLPSHEVTWVNNGTVFDAIEKDIADARQSIHIEAFIWRKGKLSDRLLAALERRRSGVQCRVLVDDVGSGPFDQDIQPRLEKMGCEARVFRPVAAVSVKEKLSRTHRKIVVVDGKIGIVGGYCIQDEWLGDGRNDKSWRDSNARIVGPVVRHLQQAFAQNWLDAGGQLLPPEAFESIRTEGPALAALVSSEDTVRMTDAERMTLLMIAAAKKRIWIANAYFAPSDAVFTALKKRRAEGIDVRVLAPGPVHDMIWVRGTQRGMYPDVVKAGIRIWEYQPSFLHSKVMLVDQDWVVVGSTNLDVMSLAILDEASLVVKDRAFAEAMERDWEADIQHSKEVGPDGKVPPSEAKR
jgi:cardiolipin synthase